MGNKRKYYLTTAHVCALLHAAKASNECFCSCVSFTDIFNSFPEDRVVKRVHYSQAKPVVCGFVLNAYRNAYGTYVFSVHVSLQEWRYVWSNMIVCGVIWLTNSSKTDSLRIIVQADLLTMSFLASTLIIYHACTSHHYFIHITHQNRTKNLLFLPHILPDFLPRGKNQQLRFQDCLRTTHDLK